MIKTIEIRWKDGDACYWQELGLVRYEDINFEMVSLRINKNRILHLYDESFKNLYDKWFMWEKLNA